MKRNKFRLVIFVLFVAVAGCVGPQCDHVVRKESMSPNGNFKAALVDVQCGATALDATWIVLSRSNESFDFKKDRIAVFEGGPISISWENDSLVVDYGSAKSFSMEKEALGLRISYKGK